METSPILSTFATVERTRHIVQAQRVSEEPTLLSKTSSDASLARPSQPRLLVRKVI